jgi:hypothetical protein
MFEMMGGLAALALAGHAMGWTVTSVLYPLFVVWMVIDALLRDARDYPGGGQNDKIVWALLMVFVHPAAFAYLFLVYRKARRRSSAAPAQASA